MQSRTQSANQLRTIVATASDELRGRLRALTKAELVQTCAAFRVRADDDSLAAVTRLAMRELAQRIQMLDEQLMRTKVRLNRITTAVAPDLVARKGVGPDTASTILVSAGDNPHRLRNERAFASLAGANPIPASSGKTTRHRLNRGGDRQLNSALWRITIVRLATDAGTRAYLERRVSEGKTKNRSDPLHQAIHRPRSLRRATPNGRRLTVGASVLVEVGSVRGRGG